MGLLNQAAATHLKGLSGDQNSIIRHEIFPVLNYISLMATVIMFSNGLQFRVNKDELNGMRV